MKIYKRPIFHIDINDKNYIGVIREKNIGGIKLRWYQILGIYFNDIKNIKKEKFIRDLKNSFGDIFLQFGFIDEIGEYNGKDFQNENILNEIKNKRENIDKELKSYGLEKTFIEHLPKGTVIIPLHEIDDFYLNLSSNGRNHYNKAIKNSLKFVIAEKNDFEKFYQVWEKTSKEKGFNIIPKNMYFDLLDLLIQEKSGHLFLVKKQDDIVSGSICVFVDNDMFYLYGATNRDYGNIGGHQFLKIEMFKRAKIANYRYIDLVGSPSFIEKDHKLYGVGKFKRNLGGKQIERYGSRDLIFNKFLYNTFKTYKKLTSNSGN